MTVLQAIIDKCYKVIKPVSTVSNSIGMVILAVMMVLTAVDVTLRKTLNAPIVGSYELIQFMMAITVAFGLAYCGIERGHVTVDLVENRLSKRNRAMLNLVTGFLGLLIAMLITWQTSVHITKLYESQVLSQVLLVPVYPFVGVVTFGLALYTLVLLVHLLEFIREVRGK